MNSQREQSPAPIENLDPGMQTIILLGIFLVSLGIFTLIAVLCIVAMCPDPKMINDYTNPQVVEALKIGQIISAIGTFLLPAMLFAFLVSRNRLEYLGLNKLGKISTMLLAGILMWGATPLINCLAELNSHMQLPSFMHAIEAWMKDSEQKADALTLAFMGHQTFWGMITNLFMIGLLAAVAEELFFRAALQKIIIKLTNSTHWGIWITGFLFSFLHFEFYGFLPRMLMGVYLGYLFVWSGSIWIPIFAHFLNNATLVLFAYFEDKNMLPKNIDQIGSNSSQIIYVIASAAFVVIMLFIIYRIENKSNTKLPVV